ncbi:MAG: PilT/PilU family type 4a pilus ATPase [Acidobacteriota bacterium]
MQTIDMDDALRKKVTNVVGECPLFHGLDGERLAQVIAHTQLVQIREGEVILQSGTEPDAFYLMISGHASVRLPNPNGEGSTEVGRIQPPNTMGEMGCLLEQPRSAEVVAAEDVTAVRFPRDGFLTMFSEIPYFGLVTSRALAVRLQQVNRRMNLPRATEQEATPDEEAAKLLPMPFIQRYRMLPMRVDGNVLVLGCVDDPSPKSLGACRQMLGSMEIKPVRITAETFDHWMGEHGGLSSFASSPDADDDERDEADGGRSPALDELLARMVAEGASDLHLSAGHAPYWRVDGEMHVLSDARKLGPKDVYDLLEPTMSTRVKEEFEAKRDCDFAYGVPGLARFRVNCYKAQRGVSAAMRLIPDKILTFPQLGLPETLTRLCAFPKGLVLVTGPTGSGKSSTLAAMVDYVNKTRAAHILTLEDPIEFVHQSQASLVHQREIGSHAADFNRGLRAALREDPDIILVGEMRDFETVELVLEAANTGHLVFATLHTSTATLAMDRIIGFFAPEEQPQIRSRIADSLRGVVAQTLCKKTGGGRVAALEIMVVTHAVSNQIREGKTHQIENTMQAGKKEGNLLLNESLERLIRGGKITREEGFSKTLDRDDLTRRLKPPSIEPQK